MSASDPSSKAVLDIPMMQSLPMNQQPKAPLPLSAKLTKDADFLAKVLSPSLLRTDNEGKFEGTPVEAAKVRDAVKSTQSGYYHNQTLQGWSQASKEESVVDIDRRHRGDPKWVPEYSQELYSSYGKSQK
jgi:hypothetical protein